MCQLLFCSLTAGLCSGVEVTDWRKKANDALENMINIKHNMNVAKNVILFIGDGMDITTITTSRIYKGQKKGKIGELESLNFETLPFVALSKTYSNDRQVTDSGASAVSLLSGRKANFGTLGVSADVTRGNCDTQAGNEINGMLHWSLAEGKATGIVTTTRMTHATPGAAYAHIIDRNWESDGEVPVEARGKCKDIAAQLIEDNTYIKVLMGGGRSKFMPNNETDPEYHDKKGARTDGRNLIQEWLQKKQEQGKTHAYVWNQTAFDKVDPQNTEYLLGLFEPSHMQYSLNRKKDGAGEPTLADMVEKAIRILKQEEKGFFLLAEGGRIDHAHHANTPKHALEDTLAFDEAVTRALQLTSDRDTLIIVTADHAHPFTLGSWASLNTSVLGFVDEAGMKTEPPIDGFAYLQLSYANGPGILGRPNLTKNDTETDDFLFPTRVPLRDDTHGGQDVAVYARGPMAHLVNGVQESNYFAYLMSYASCVGPRKDKCSRHDLVDIIPTAASINNKPAYSLMLVIVLVSVIVWGVQM